MAVALPPIDAFQARWAWTRPGREPMRENVRIDIVDGRIAALAGGASQSGASAGLVMPALCNAHDHGRGLKTLAYGAEDEAVEVWLPATYLHPSVDPYLVAAAAFARMARSGCGSVVHCHLSRPVEALMDEARAVAAAAADVGLRVAFVVPLRDRHRMAYADDEAVLAHLHPDDRDAVSARWVRPIPPIADQISSVEEIARGCNAPLVQVQYGPVGVEWCSDLLLEGVAEAAARAGRRIHMHLLESRNQRQWADRAYPDGVVRHLDRLGILSPRLTVAHGVWLRPEECALLAERGVTVSVNTSSNLRLRSGIAPLAEMMRAGVRVALGMDALAFDDDDDALRELRLAWRLHAATGIVPEIGRETVLEAATAIGPEAAGGEPGAFGAVAPGYAADLLLLDQETMTEDLIEGLCDLEDVFFARASARHVRGLIVAGNEVVRDGIVLGVDEPAIAAELLAQARASADELRDARPLLRRYQSALRRFYLDGGHQR